MEKLKLFFDCEFTSLSPDGQLISLGIVSEEIRTVVQVGKGTASDIIDNLSKSFYAEFVDFQIERCDDWVKENVVGKLSFKIPNDNKGAHSFTPKGHNFTKCIGNTSQIKNWLSVWLTQFKDYEITFVTDCGTYDWYWLVQLLAEWEQFPGTLAINAQSFKTGDIDEVAKLWRECGSVLKIESEFNVKAECIRQPFKTGLPKLPSNISPVPLDLNDLIAHKKGISVREAFDLNRENLLTFDFGMDNGFGGKIHYKMHPLMDDIPKHNALWDARIIKEIYNKLI